jgi:predicted O-methyltransferase YrrM
LWHLRAIDTIHRAESRNPRFPELVQRIREAGTASLEYFRNGYLSEGGLRLQQNPFEFAALCTLLTERIPLPTFMEIGSASGGTCLFLSREIGFTKLLSLDDGQHPDACYQNEHLGRIQGCIRFIGDSHSRAAHEFISTHVSAALDVALIDGDHSAPGVWQDIQLTLKFSRPGTVIIFHDTLACEGVEHAWFKCIAEEILEPLAEYIGAEIPLGIGVGLAR